MLVCVFGVCYAMFLFVLIQSSSEAAKAVRVTLLCSFMHHSAELATHRVQSPGRCDTAATILRTYRARPQTTYISLSLIVSLSKTLIEEFQIAALES